MSVCEIRMVKETLLLLADLALRVVDAALFDSESEVLKSAVLKAATGAKNPVPCTDARNELKQLEEDGLNRRETMHGSVAAKVPKQHDEKNSSTSCENINVEGIWMEQRSENERLKAFQCRAVDQMMLWAVRSLSRIMSFQVAEVPSLINPSNNNQSNTRLRADTEFRLLAATGRRCRQRRNWMRLTQNCPRNR